MSVLRDPVDSAPATPFFEARLAEILAAGDAPVPSPCVNICRIDPETSVCFGCRRLLDEIAGWGRMDDAARRAVWMRLPGREPACPVPPAEPGS